MHEVRPGRALTPIALALTDEGLSVFTVSFGNVDLHALPIGGGLPFTPPGNPSSLAWGWKVYIAEDSADGAAGP